MVSTERIANNKASSCLALAMFLCATSSASAFSSPMFQEVKTMQRTSPSKMEGVEIELPDFDELFGRIQQVSPLARQVIQGSGETNQERGFDHIDDSWPSNLKWKNLEKKKRSTVHQIDKIDNFQNLGSPIFRFRSSLKGPCVGLCFANFIMNLEDRKKWDPQIEQVREEYPIYDLDTANIAMGFGKYGDCSRLGVGYCQTKGTMGITGREQLTMCGIQEFPSSGSTVIWGTEMEPWHDHLLPAGERYTRAKSHLFSTTLTPTGDDTFDVEYVLQLEIGGKIPTWLTQPIVMETVKGIFRHAESYFGGGEGSEVHQYFMEAANQDSLAERHSILMTP
jgi:hypothetical protein